MNDDMERRRAEFLQRLASLSRETGIYIGGCGDCGSPWLAEGDDQDTFIGFYLTPTANGYTVRDTD